MGHAIGSPGNGHQNVSMNALRRNRSNNVIKGNSYQNISAAR
jgi:hypothetical protein